jgi:hypothetical protein
MQYARKIKTAPLRLCEEILLGRVERREEYYIQVRRLERAGEKRAEKAEGQKIINKLNKLNLGGVAASREKNRQ